MASDPERYLLPRLCKHYCPCLPLQPSLHGSEYQLRATLRSGDDLQLFCALGRLILR